MAAGGALIAASRLVSFSLLTEDIGWYHCKEFSILSIEAKLC